MIVRKNYFYTVSRSRQVALTELRVGFCNLNYDLKSNYSRTTIDKLHNISLFSFRFFFFYRGAFKRNSFHTCCNSNYNRYQAPYKCLLLFIIILYIKDCVEADYYECGHIREDSKYYLLQCSNYTS